MHPDLLKNQNPWWTHADWSRQDPHLVGLDGKSYEYERPEAKTLALPTEAIHIIRGPRQVGKTTLLKRIAQNWLAHPGHLPEQLLFLSCESLKDFSALEELLFPWLLKHTGRGGIFLDEISFVNEWPRAILSFSNKGLLIGKTVWITGSNARDLKESGERLPGRRGSGQDIQIYPFGFRELRTLRCFAGLDDAQLIRLYLRIGGFPHAVEDFATHGLVRDETYHTYRNWIIGDAVRYGLSGEILSQILFRIYETLGSRVTWSTLIETTGVKSHETAYNYLQHLEDSFIAHVLTCYEPSKKIGNPAKSRKLYFVDPLLYAMAFSWRSGISNSYRWFEGQLENPKFEGKILEAAVASAFKRTHPRVYFWYSTKTKQEVDLLVDRGADFDLYEIKRSSTKPLGRALNKAIQLIRLDDVPRLQSSPFN